MLHTFFRLLLIIGLGLQLSSCITAKKINYLQKPDKNIPSYPEVKQYEDYRLKVGDRLYVKVYSTHEATNQIFNSTYNQNSSYQQSGNSSYSDLYSYSIQTNGTIQFPMIGEVFMLGMTVREATAQLEKSIEPLYQFSTVELRVISKYFSVIGSGKSGFYPIVREKINIFQAMAMAGDIGVYGDRSMIRVVRETDSGTVIRKFDLRSRDILNSEYFYVEANDIIYIQTMDEQFFSIQNLPSLISTGISTISFGVFLYDLLFIPGSN